MRAGGKHVQGIAWRLLLWCEAVWFVIWGPNASEKHTTSIFRVEQYYY